MITPAQITWSQPHILYSIIIVGIICSDESNILLYSLTALWVKKLESNRDWFLQQEDLKSDESKRPGKSIDTGELFGFQGSFRRLSLD
jgi:hypothetical protein